jgi:glycerol-3-phosphate acyltransferase PlsY
MQATYTALLVIAAFITGAIPFSVIIGRLFLKKEITAYGDGNPGAANVFRAGGPLTGMSAVVMDVAKGIPFVLLSHKAFDLPIMSSVIVAVAAVLGHAYSPFLRWHGGKAIAVTFGVMLGLPEYYILLTFMACMIFCYILVKPDAWKVTIGASAALIFLTITKGYSWEPLLMACLLVILVIKHFEALHTIPGLTIRLSRRLQTR